MDPEYAVCPWVPFQPAFPACWPVNGLPALPALPASPGFPALPPLTLYVIYCSSSAQLGCKITFSLDVIHDIPPGLDYAGYNRAPLYNVGRVMKDISGDVYNDGGFNSENYYNKSRTIKKG